MKAYYIRVYTMTGNTLLTYEEEEIDPDTVVSIGDNNTIKVKTRLPGSNFYSTVPLGKKYKEDGLLPYFAKVTQDLPGHTNFKPEVYPLCQLRMVKKGGYNYFKNLKTGEELLIALNSNSYEPIFYEEKQHGTLIPEHIGVARTENYRWFYSKELKKWFMSGILTV